MADWEKKFVLVPICLYVKWGRRGDYRPPLTVTNKFTIRTFARFRTIHSHIHLYQVSTRKTGINLKERDQLEDLDADESIIKVNTKKLYMKGYTRLMSLRIWTMEKTTWWSQPLPSYQNETCSIRSVYLLFRTKSQQLIKRVDSYDTFLRAR